MKILYLSDNRCRGNFGCRATSTALSQIIGGQHQIIGWISGRYTNWKPGPLVVNHHWSQNKYLRKAHGKYWKYISQIYFMFHRFIDKHNFFLGKHDFIGYNLDKSIDYFIKCLPANPHIQEFDLRQYDFDALVVNGEGSFIFATPAWRESMIITMLMYWAQKLGKKVFFLNAMLSDDPNSPHNERTINLVRPVFEKCDVVQVREKVSFEYAKKFFPNARLKLRPDALFSWYSLINDSFKVKEGKYFIPFGSETDANYYSFDYSKPYILLCGSSSSLITTHREEAIKSYCLFVKRLKQNFSAFNIYLIIPCEGDEFLKEVGAITKTPVIPMETNIIVAGKILANASLFFTGRYHPAILASLGGTPCIFMDSNSHKTSSLQELLLYKEPKEYSCVPTENEIEEMIKKGTLYLGNAFIRDTILNRAKELSNQSKTIIDLIE